MSLETREDQMKPLTLTLNSNHSIFISQAQEKQKTDIQNTKAKNLAYACA